VNPSHDDCLQILADPSTQNILEKFGYEYSLAGAAEFRKSRVNIVPILVSAIVAELQSHGVFPPSARLQISATTGLYIEKRMDGFAVVNVEKPSIVSEWVHAKPTEVARSYAYKVLDDYWLQADRDLLKDDLAKILKPK
jgi:hypothetical protein